MKSKNLGNSGLTVSVVGLGCNNFGWQIGAEESKAVIDKAIDVGISFFDTADVYGKRGGSETILGRILGNRRKNIVLATKFGMPMDDQNTLKGASRRYIFNAVEDSLRRLNTDWIDLYQIHTPDSATPIDETLKALDDLVRQGKVRYIGCSNFPAWQVVDACWTSRSSGLSAFISCQDEYNLLERGIERELIPAMKKVGLGLLPYFPLASGLLTGKYRKGEAFATGTRFASWKAAPRKYVNDRNWDILESLDRFCRERGRTLLDLAFSWLLANPAVASVIAGATRPEQVEMNVAAAEWMLTDEDRAEVDRITAASS